MPVVDMYSRRQPRREEASPWKLGGAGPITLAKRVWKEMGTEEDDVFTRAAALSYYFLLAVFPMLLAIIAIVGVIVGQDAGFRQALFDYVGRVAPSGAADVIHQTIDQTARASGGLKAVLGILGALWAASAGMAALMTSLNKVYDVEEGRPWWKSRGIALALTVAVSALILLAGTIVILGGPIAEWVGNAVGLGSGVVLAWKIVQWPIALVFLVLTFALIYYFAPDVDQPKWYWVTPGSVIGVLLWIAASLAFKLYLSFSNNYSATYGSLGGVVILMLWFYITGLALLAGGEINAEIEHIAAERGRADAKLPGEKEAPAA